MRHTLSAAEARRVSLAAQGFARPRPRAATTRHITGAISRMGVLQIDSVNVFARSHYMPIFSRIGAYDTTSLDTLLFTERAPYVEYWAHMAAFIPVEDWPLFGFRMKQMHAKESAPGGWLATHPQVVNWIRAELAAKGALRPSEIEYDVAHERRKGSWWEWDDVKRTLEHLWLAGEVMIAGRRGFERRYALSEQVLPASVHARTVSYPEALHTLTRKAAHAMGVFTITDLADYWRLRDRPALNAVVRDLVDDGELLPVTVQGWGTPERPAAAWITSDAVIPRRINAVSLLTPFDPVVWFRERAARMFDFTYRIEIYTPAAQRVYGYYSLPVLVDDKIVARIDLKADRQNSRLLVQSAWWEHGASPLAAPRIAEELATAAAWQGLATVSIADHGTAARDLRVALPHAQAHVSPLASASPKMHS